MTKDVFEKEFSNWLFNQELKSDEAYRERGFPSVSEILENVDKIVTENQGLPEGLIDYLKVTPPPPKRSQGYPIPYRACFFELGYQFPNGGLSLKLESSRPREITTDPRQLITGNGLWEGEVNFYVDSVGAKYFGQVQRVRQSVESYFVNRGFSRGGLESVSNRFPYNKGRSESSH